jgi:hypothetical protein
MHRAALVVSAVALMLAVTLPAGAAATSDEQVAHAGVLVASDFPAGWKESPQAKSSDKARDAAAAKVVSCRPYLAFSKANRKNPRAKSPNFDMGHSNVTNTVSVYASTAKAEAAMATFSDPRMSDCLQKLFDTAYAQQLKRDPKTAKQVTSVSTVIAPIPDVRVGDQALAYQGTVDIGLKDRATERVGLGFAAARVGRAIAGYSWTSDTDISATLQPAIVTSVDRLQEAQSTG